MQSYFNIRKGSHYFHTDIKIAYPSELPLCVYFIYTVSLLVYFRYLCKNGT